MVCMIYMKAVEIGDMNARQALIVAVTLSPMSSVIVIDEGDHLLLYDSTQHLGVNDHHRP
jgi:hypothetical protein